MKTESQKPAEKEERNKIRGSRDKQSAPTLFPEGLVRGLHPDDISGINSSATGLEKRFAKVFDILPIVEKIMPICPTDKYGRVYSWLDVNYMVFHKIKGWDEMLKTLAGLDII